MPAPITFIGKIAFTAAMAAAICAPAGAEIVNLVNGDRITGKVVSSSDEKIVLDSPFGQVVIPKKSISKISPDPVQEAAKTNVAEAKEPAQKEAEPAAESAAPAEDPTAPEPKLKEPQWVVDYRNFIKENLPKDWQFRLRGGMALKETTSTNFSLSAAFDVKKEWELNKFEPRHSTIILPKL